MPNVGDTTCGSAIIIRPAKTADIPAVRSLLVSVVDKLDIYSKAARASEIGQYQEDSLVEIAGSGIFIVAEDGEGLCGFCFGYDDDALIWLSWFIVDPRARGCGLGETLIARFLEAATSVTHKVWCDTRSNNETSKVILRKCGFDELITIKRHWYDQDFTIWQKFVR